LLAESRLSLDPIVEIIDEEGLRPHVIGSNPAGLLFVDHVLSEGILRKTVEGHRDTRRLELLSE
jgi:hypothetical protein